MRVNKKAVPLLPKTGTTFFRHSLAVNYSLWKRKKQGQKKMIEPETGRAYYIQLKNSLSLSALNMTALTAMVHCLIIGGIYWIMSISNG